MYDEPSVIRFEATLTSRQSQASGTDKFSSSTQKRATHAAAAATSQSQAAKTHLELSLALRPFGRVGDDLVGQQIDGVEHHALRIARVDDGRCGRCGLRGSGSGGFLGRHGLAWWSGRDVWSFSFSHCLLHKDFWAELRAGTAKLMTS